MLNTLNHRRMNLLMRQTHARCILQTWPGKSYIQRLVRVRVIELPLNSLYKSQNSSRLRLNVISKSYPVFGEYIKVIKITSTCSRSLSPMTYWNITGFDPRGNEMDLHLPALKSYFFSRNQPCKWSKSCWNKGWLIIRFKLFWSAWMGNSKCHHNC
jgi:hypothetical protein